MHPAQIVEHFLAKRIILSAEGNHIRFNAPGGSLTAELREILIQNKQAILQHLQSANGIQNTSLPEFPGNAYPLSFAQQRLWFHDQWDPRSTAYHLSYACRLSGPLDLPALEASINALAARHDSLRTTFAGTGEHPLQVIGPVRPLSLSVHDLTHLPEPETDTTLEHLIRQNTQRSFDLTTGPLWHTHVIRLNTDLHVFLVTMHHIITDGWSMGIFFKELSAFYTDTVAGRLSLPAPLPVQYADYAVSQRQNLQGDILDTQLTYWRNKLADAPTALEIPTDFPRPPRQSYQGGHIPFELTPALAESLQSLVGEEKATRFMVLLAAFQLLLFRYTGQRDILLGIPIAGRTQSDLEEVIGLFVNTLVIRTQFHGRPTYREILRQVRASCLEAYSHQDLPFEKLVESLQPARDLSRHPLFQVMFQLFSRSEPTLTLPGVTAAREPIRSQNAKFDMNVTLRESHDRIKGTLEYSTDLFEEMTVQRLVVHYQRLLEEIGRAPDQPVETLPLLSDGERRQILVEWNETACPYPPDTCVPALFERQVERTPDGIAVVSDVQQLTYRELNARANRLAHFLRAHGVGPEARVGLCLDRDPFALISMLGVLKAGAAYVPLDPNQPAVRLQHLVADSAPQVIITQQELAPIFEGTSALRLTTDSLSAPLKQWPSHNPHTCCSDLNLAYIIYTSGSTGTPKGVMISHRSITNLLMSFTESLQLNQCDVHLAITSFSFDISVCELLATLITGGRLVLAGNAADIDGRDLCDILQDQGVTVMQATPTLWHVLIHTPRPAGLCQLKTAVTGGEPLTRPVAEHLGEWAHTIYNAYGPTETTVWSTVGKVTHPDTHISVGRPLANTSIFLSDHHGAPVPIGVVGDMFIGGEGLGRGYSQQPAMTAEKFSPDPFSSLPGQRLYHTGDRARYRHDGSIEFWGRTDHQVKLRGFRIELGEIETQLLEHSSVQKAVVLCREEVPGDKYLVAYVVPRPETALEPATVRSFLLARLPGHMVPSVFVMLPDFPLTPNGKINRRALPVPDSSHRRQTLVFVNPRTPLEELLAEIWQDLLKIDSIGVHDNFFSLGGHSLLATQIMSRLRLVLEIECPLRSIFEYPTIAGLASVIDAQLLMAE